MNEITISGFYDEISSALSTQIAVLHELGETYMCPRNVDGKNIADYTFEEFKEKIFPVLKKEGVKTSQKYVWCIMKENRWKAKYIKPYTVTTKSEDYSEKLQNLLNRHFNPTKPYGYCLYMYTR